MTEDSKGHRELLVRAEEALTAAYGQPVEVAEYSELRSQHTMLRATLNGAPAGQPDRIILKRVTTTQFNTNAAVEGQSQRFLNEWSSLEFLGGLLAGPFGPRLLAGDHEYSFVLLEDLGAHPSIRDVLNGRDAGAAEAALIRLGRLLGRMQAAAYGRAGQFRALQDGHHTTSPLSDSNLRFDDLSSFEEMAAALGFEFGPGFYEQTRAVQAEVHDPSSLFYTFTHCDAGPHNFMALGGEEVRLLDFEFGDFGFGPLDVVSARLGFPHMNPMNHVPFAIVEKLEAAYQAELMKAAPEVGDGAVFRRALATACAHWTTSRSTAFVWGRFLKKALQQNGDAVIADMAKRNKTTEETVWRWFGGAALLLRNFVITSEQTGYYGEMAAGVQQLLDYLLKHWPQIEVAPTFPAFSA